MTLYNPAEPRVRPRVGAGRRRFDILTIGLHWATVALIAGMFASAWLLLASDREHAAMLLTVHRSLGVVTWVVAIIRLGWRFIRLLTAISAEHAEGPTAARQGQ